MLGSLLLVVGLVVVAAVASLLTTTGLRMTLAAATAMSGGAVQVTHAEGRLIGPLHLEGVNIDAAGTSVVLTSADLDWSPRTLWRERRLDVTRVDVQGVRVRLGPGGGEGGGSPPVIAAPFAVRLPDAHIRDVRVETADGLSVAVADAGLSAHLDAQALTVDDLSVRDVTIETGGGDAEAIDEITMAAIYDGREVALERLDVSAPRGRVNAHGTLAVDPAGSGRLSVSWSTAVDGRSLEGEGEVWGGAGRIAFEQQLTAPAPVRIEGEVSDPFGTPNWQAHAAFEDLDAGLIAPRAQGVTVAGSLDASGGARSLSLQLRSQLREPGLGPWELSLEASRSDETWRVSQLTLLQQDGPGRLRGSARITPEQGALRIDARVQGSDLDIAGVVAPRIDAEVDIGTDPAAAWTLNIAVDELALPGVPPMSVRAQASGTAAEHALEFDVERDARALHLAARGALRNGVWSGTVSDGTVMIDEGQRLRQVGTAPVRVEAAAAQLSQFCWQGPATQACAQGSWRREGESTASVNLDRLDLADLPADLFPTGLAADGVVAGTAAVSLVGSRLMSLDATLSSSRLELRHTDVEGVATVTSLLRVNVTAETREDGLDIGANAEVEPAGQLRVALNLPGWQPGVEPERQRLDGEIALTVGDLGQLAAFMPQLNNPQGSLDGRIKISGRLASPSFSGRASLSGGAAQITGAGISVHDVGIEVTGDDSGRLVVSGSARSGEGRIAVNGDASVAGAGEWSFRLHVTGSEFEAVKRRDVQLVASPDLEVSAEPGRIEVLGNVKVPSADIQLSAPKGSIERSPDVVVVGERENAETETFWNVHARVTLVLGDKVKVQGYGFEGRVTGELTVLEEPGRTTVAEGELRAVDAAYLAYGQSLDIKTGRLVFAGGPIDNPSLDVRAVRVADDVTAGVQVNGRLKEPELSLFSQPPLPDGDILSYIVFGKPMAGASSAQGQVLMEAAAALGGGSGPRLVSRIADTFGLSELRLTGSPGDKDTALQLGRYLSPRLYLTYVIGLYDKGSAVMLRYSLTDHLKLETTTGTNSSADVLYSIER